MPVTIDGAEISAATIDGADVQEITMDGDVVWIALISDGYEDNDIAEYYGPTVDYTTNTTHTYNGSYALNVSSDNSNEPILHSNGGGYEYCEVWIYHDTSVTSGGGGAVLHGQDSQNYMAARWGNNGELWLILEQNGSRNILAKTSVSFSGDTWQKVSIEVSGDTYTARAYNSSGTEKINVSATDTTFSSGDIGVRLHRGGGTWGDDLYAE